MAFTNTECQQRFKARMYAAGFRQKQVWIRQDTGKRPAKMDMRSFTARMEKLTANWGDTDNLAQMFGLLVKITEARKEVLKQKKSG